MTDFVKFSLIFEASAIVLAACSKAEAPKAESKPEPVKAATSAPAASEDLCLTMGPQTPRDIASKAGLNTTTFAVAPPSTQMNLRAWGCHGKGGRIQTLSLIHISEPTRPY